MSTSRLIGSLYFHSSDERPPSMLVTSLAHVAWQVDDYVLFTNINPLFFPRKIQDAITIVNPSEVETLETRQILAQLTSAWATNKLPVNYAPIELHCFRRWLILRDYLETLNHEDSSRLIFCHDWDDIVVGNIKHEILNQISNLSAFATVRSRALIIAKSTNEFGKLSLSPNNITLNLATLRLLVLEITNLFRLHHDLCRPLNAALNFCDMYPLAALWYRLQCFSKLGSVINLADIEAFRNAPHFSENIRETINFAYSLIHFDPPLQRDYKYLDATLDPALNSFLLFDTLSYTTKRIFHFHFQGVEGKYLFNLNTHVVLSSYQQNIPALANLLQ